MSKLSPKSLPPKKRNSKNIRIAPIHSNLHSIKGSVVANRFPSF